MKNSRDHTLSSKGSEIKGSTFLDTALKSTFEKVSKLCLMVDNTNGVLGWGKVLVCEAACGGRHMLDPLGDKHMV